MLDSRSFCCNLRADAVSLSLFAQNLYVLVSEVLVGGTAWGKSCKTSRLDIILASLLGSEVKFLRRNSQTVPLCICMIICLVTTEDSFGSVATCAFRPSRSLDSLQGFLCLAVFKVHKDHNIDLAGDMEATPHSEEEDREHNPEFKWGESRGDGGTDNVVQFYKSFTYDGVDYSLYDSVYLFAKGEPEPYIGKLVKIWELQDHRKYIRVIWYFRPVEILNWLKGDVPLQNEIFLACGNGKGLLNDNFLEILVGKSNVVCTSKDRRNPQPSDAEVRMADYVFYRTFDVGKCEISDRFEDIIAGTEVRHFFNVKRQAISDPKPGVNQSDNWKTDSSFKLDFPEAVAALEKNAKPGVQTSPSVKESKRSITGALDKGHISDEGKQKSVQDSLHLEAFNCKPFKGMVLPGEPARRLEKLESDVSPTLARKESHTNISQKPRVRLKESSEKPPGSSLRASPHKAKGEARKELVGQVMLSVVNTSNKATKLSIKADFKFAEEKSRSKLESNVSPTLARKESHTNIPWKPRVCLKESAEKPPGSSRRTSPYKAKSEARKEPSVQTLESNVSPALTRKESYTNFSQKPRVGLKESAEKPPGSSLRISSYEVESEARKELVGQDRSKWFKPLPWEDAMQRGHEQGTLVLLRNLDPCYTSPEVEDIVLYAFKERCSAKMIQHNTFSSPCYGEAYVIFDTREAAEMAITKLESGCLMLPNGRPLVGCKQAPTEIGRPPRFAGHLSIDKIKTRVERQEKRDAVSTSHFSQANTLEYDLALEWCLLQQRSEHWWKALHQKHEEEYSRIKLQLKNP